MKLNQIYNENCLDTMARMPDDFIDLVVISPPYDNLRTYHGYEFDFESTANELFRVMKTGGVVVWVSGDQTINGSETGTSFRQALFFMECGFNLHDTMIYEKCGCAMPNSNRYLAVFEFMFVLSKGKPKTFNPINDRLNLFPERWGAGRKTRNKDGSFQERKNYIATEYGRRFNIWKCNNGGQGYGGDEYASEHPATFPERLANDHIISWSNEGELVYDPLMGSGTTAKMAILNQRYYIGSETSQNYCKLAEKRINNTCGIFLELIRKRCDIN